jgi:hypothetical protein
LHIRLGVVAAIYAAVLAAAVVLVYERHLQYVNHPEDVAASGGMYAGGDWILELFILCMLLVPTFLLALVIRNSEGLYTGFCRVMLAMSLTAPACLAIFMIPAVSQGKSLLGEICVERMFGSPIVLVGLAFSRLLAKFDRSKRLTLYALLIEFVTIVVMVALLMFSGGGSRG